ncbi:methylated-DNA--[protein]-cysteine S-methyltransferase [Aristophania vespae]|uniref:Methylated-DNA--[protein]-cysteine S-methyltransferase n=1 Tax=Aristophania vespae TaxID=2697033 RepID=A0A6P1NI99_9PROT|nr:methylated-DNA--[protein]-cysteine S-methyltransferase [Aristophania vespae]QHI96260.1 methylated-DNA--[protein]-cysteine S-methyltransferase [Aristophania vespae]
MPQLSFQSPFGTLSLSEDDGAIVSLDEGQGRDQEKTALLEHVVSLLQDYFEGHAIDFSDVPVKFFGTAYQLRVWEALRTIPYGETCFYGDLAKKVGGSPQSVGHAVGLNPIPLIVPCHRVIGRNGLTGYSAFDGVDDKAWLLELEKGL